MIKAVCTVIFILLFSGCTNSKSTNLYFVYNDYTPDNELIKKLVLDIQCVEGVDSVKVIGRPLYQTSIDIQLDTLRLQRYGIDPDSIDIKTKGFNSYYELGNQIIYQNESIRIPLNAVAYIQQVSESLIEDVFLQ